MSKTSINHNVPVKLANDKNEEISYAVAGKYEYLYNSVPCSYSDVVSMASTINDRIERPHFTQLTKVWRILPLQ